MFNDQSARGSGIPITGTVNAATLVVSAVPGKLVSFKAASSSTAPVYVQLFDAATLAGAEGSGTWVGTPFYQDIVTVGSTAAQGASEPMVTLPYPVPLANGLVMLLSTSHTAYAADSVPVFLGAQFVPDIPSKLGSAGPA